MFYVITANLPAAFKMATVDVVKHEIFLFFFCFFSLFIYSTGRRHELKLQVSININNCLFVKWWGFFFPVWVPHPYFQNEARKSFELSKFGFLKDGSLQVEVSKMVYNDQVKFLRNKDLSNNVSMMYKSCIQSSNNYLLSMLFFLNCKLAFKDSWLLSLIIHKKSRKCWKCKK